MDRRRFLSLAALTAGAAALGSKVAAAATATTGTVRRAVTRASGPTITIPPGTACVRIELWGAEGLMTERTLVVQADQLDGTMLTTVIMRQDANAEHTVKWGILTSPQFPTLQLYR